MGDERGNAPSEENFHNWISTADGLVIHFEDDQFAHGLAMVTVPWVELTDLLATRRAGVGWVAAEVRCGFTSPEVSFGRGTSAGRSKRRGRVSR